jgi:hypothetical protein
LLIGIVLAVFNAGRLSDWFFFYQVDTYWELTNTNSGFESYRTRLVWNGHRTQNSRSQRNSSHYLRTLLHHHIFFFHGILRDKQPQLHMFSFLLTKLKRVNDPNQSKYGYVDYHSVLGNTLRIVSKIQRNIDPSYELNQQKKPH